MLTNEEQKVINGIKDTIRKAESDFEAGLITEEQLQELNKLIEDAADKIEAISSGS